MFGYASSKITAFSIDAKSLSREVRIQRGNRVSTKDIAFFVSACTLISIKADRTPWSGCVTRGASVLCFRRAHKFYHYCVDLTHSEYISPQRQFKVQIANKCSCSINDTS